MSIPVLLEMLSYLCFAGAVVGATQLIPKFELRSGVPAGEWDASAGPDRFPPWRSSGPATGSGQTRRTLQGSARNHHPNGARS